MSTRTFEFSVDPVALSEVLGDCELPLAKAE